MLRYWADSKQQQNHTMNKNTPCMLMFKAAELWLLYLYSHDVQTFSFNSTSLTDTDQKPFFHY